MKYFMLGFILFCTWSTQSTEFRDSFIQGVSSIAELNDPNREAEAWATCSVAYDFYADMIKSPENTATSELLKQQSNGAKISILMSQMIRLDVGASPSKFEAAYKLGQHLMETLPSQKEIQIKSEFELLKAQKKPVSHLTDKILNTYKICQSSGEIQQTYVDLFRELGTAIK